MWSLFEPVHAVTYFSPQAGPFFEAAGLRGFWRRYFAGRAAPLGPVGAGPVIGAFFGFAPAMVTRALPDVWTRITPQAAIEARLSGARAALAEVTGDLDLTEAADRLEAAAREIDLPGRTLAAAYADLPWPDDAPGRLWHAATLLREHRGDGHVAALLTAGFDGCESLVLRNAIEDGRLRASMQAARGWTDEEWQATAERLRTRGWLSSDGSVTATGSRAYAEVEAQTDRLARAPWERTGAQATERCATLLQPLADRLLPLLPADNPIPLRSQA
jgi:helix-turn-helix protein